MIKLSKEEQNEIFANFKSKFLESVCQKCGKSFKHRKCETLRKFCDKKCQVEWQKTILKPRRYYTKTCFLCNKQYLTTKHTQIFCSSYCMQKERRLA